MSYRTILVHLTDERRLPAMLEAAIPIALCDKARLIGLAVLPPIIIVPDMEGVAGTAIEEHRVAYRAQMNRIRDAFVAATKARGVDAAWEELDGQEVNPFGTVATVVVDRARAADLILAGQANPSWAMSGMLDVGEQLVTESGRPILLVPKTGALSGSTKRVLVAWNGSRESARAVFDAIPLLAAAEQVLVTRLDTDGKAEQPGADICAAIARHGVKCEALQPQRLVTGVGSALLSIAKEQSADLLVMGCYGHSRLREFILGGATRYVLDHMTLPVLMSH